MATCSSGAGRRRTDFYGDDFGVVGEADGRGKYDSRDVLWQEKERQEGLKPGSIGFSSAIEPVAGGLGS